MEAEKRRRDPHPREKANILSYLSLIWTVNIFLKDIKEKCNADNIWTPFSKHKTQELGDRLESQWEAEVKKCSKLNKKPSFMFVIYRTFWFEFATLGFILSIDALSNVYIRPWLLRNLIEYFTTDTVTRETALLTGGGLVLAILYSNIVICHYAFSAFTLGMMIRAACITLVYRKSLRFSSGAVKSTGQIVNLVSNDVSRFDSVVMTANALWIGPLLTILVSIALYNEVGLSGLPGLIIICIITCLQLYGARLTSMLRRKIAFKTDERIRLTEEILNGVHVIKMYAWEKPFKAIIDQARKIELGYILRANLVRGCYMAFGLFTTRSTVFCTLITYALLGEHLVASRIYVVISYLSIISGVLTGLFVRGIQEFAEVRVSVHRLQNFLLMEESCTLKYVEPQNGQTITAEEKTNTAILMNNITANWSEDQGTEYNLFNLNLNIKRGDLTIVIGSVASGKTSLIQLMAREMRIVKGEMNINGSISYASQDPWMFGGTVRQNILLGLPLDKERYKKVIRACSLERDLELFEDGDGEMVGERGASLSGGQRARINLARAIYKEADIYLLDDPLSAVDTHVAKNLVQICFKGFLRGKTIVLATHQIQFMQDASHLILLKDGFIEDQGTFPNIIRRHHEYLRFSRAAEISNERSGSMKFKDKERPILQRLPSRQRLPSFCDDNISHVSSITDLAEPEVVVEEQTPTNRDTDFIYKGSPYLGYLQIGSSFFLPVLFVLTLLGAQFSCNWADVFVKNWIIQEEEVATQPQEKYYVNYNTLYLYGGIILSLFILAFSRGIFFFLISQKCSRRLHSLMTTNVLYTDMSFFNNNPSGALLNRFTRDLGSTDEMLPKAFLDTSQVFGQAIGSVIVCATLNYLILIPFFILTIVSYLARRFFMRTSLNLKRLEGICRSPVFTHLSATLQGLPTIRAHGSQAYLIQEFDLHQDLHTSALYSFLSSQQAYTLILDLFSTMYFACVVFMFLIFSDGVAGAEVGLAITQTMTLTSLLQWGFRQASETTNLMTSVERILAFKALKVEETNIENKIMPPPLWPGRGKIVFEDLSMYYNDNTPVLKGLNLTINDGEKVGIVGRTGAGKSSFVQAIFRFAKMEGNIIIDGINTRDIPLNVLRSRIGIIPQNPVLFSGDIRKNLDPFSDYPDYLLIKTLDELEVPDFLKEHGLDTQVSDGGSNLSIGQRQLVCLARAILKNCTIVVLDEATANVDTNTDRIIQSIIRKKFKKCTVLTIAHRLNTIMDSDKILVMDAGRVAEFDVPYFLLQKRRGNFFSLVQETGREMSTELISQAEQYYWRKQQETLLE